MFTELRTAPDPTPLPTPLQTPLPTPPEFQGDAASKIKEDILRELVVGRHRELLDRDAMSPGLRGGRVSRRHDLHGRHALL